MKYAMKIMLLMLILIVANRVAAETPININWTAPTKNVDGTDLKTEIGGYDLKAKILSGEWQWLTFVKSDGNEIKYEYKATQNGEYCFAVRTVLTGGKIKSDYTEAKCITINETALPDAPKNLTITITISG